MAAHLVLEAQSMSFSRKVAQPTKYRKLHVSKGQKYLAWNLEIVVCFCVDLRSWWGGFDLLLHHQAGELLSQSLSVFGVGESEHDRVEDGGTLGRAGRDLSCQGGEQFPGNKVCSATRLNNAFVCTIKQKRVQRIPMPV